MTQKGTHTWDLIIQYHKCPKCGYIIESRKDFYYRLGKWVKDVSCERCGHQFLLERKTDLTFGPLIGSPQPPEVEWS